MIDLQRLAGFPANLADCISSFRPNHRARQIAKHCCRGADKTGFYPHRGSQDRQPSAVFGPDVSPRPRHEAVPKEPSRCSKPAAHHNCFRIHYVDEKSYAVAERFSCTLDNLEGRIVAFLSGRCYVLAPFRGP